MSDRCPLCPSAWLKILDVSQFSAILKISLMRIVNCHLLPIKLHVKFTFLLDFRKQVLIWGAVSCLLYFQGDVSLTFCIWKNSVVFIWMIFSNYFPILFFFEVGRSFMVAQTFSLAFFTVMTVATKTGIKKRSSLKTYGRPSMQYSVIWHASICQIMLSE